MRRRRQITRMAARAAMPTDFLIDAFDCAGCANEGLEAIARRRRRDRHLPASTQLVPALDLLACPVCGHSCSRHVEVCGTCPCHNLPESDCPRFGSSWLEPEWIDRG